MCVYYFSDLILKSTDLSNSDATTFEQNSVDSSSTKHSRGRGGDEDKASGVDDDHGDTSNKRESRQRTGSGRSGRKRNNKERNRHGRKRCHSAIDITDNTGTSTASASLTEATAAPCQPRQRNRSRSQHKSRKHDVTTPSYLDQWPFNIHRVGLVKSDTAIVAVSETTEVSGVVSTADKESSDHDDEERIRHHSSTAEHVSLSSASYQDISDVAEPSQSEDSSSIVLNRSEAAPWPFNLLPREFLDINPKLNDIVLNEDFLSDADNADSSSAESAHARPPLLFSSSLFNQQHPSVVAKPIRRFQDGARNSLVSNGSDRSKVTGTSSSFHNQQTRDDAALAVIILDDQSQGQEENINYVTSYDDHPATANQNQQDSEVVIPFPVEENHLSTELRTSNASNSETDRDPYVRVSRRNRRTNIDRTKRIRHLLRHHRKKERFIAARSNRENLRAHLHTRTSQSSHAINRDDKTRSKSSSDVRALRSEDAGLGATNGDDS